MADLEPPVKTAAGAAGESDPSLLGDIRALIEDGRTLLEAEVAYRKAQASYALKRAKGIALLLGLAVFFVFFALMALVVGLLLALAPLLTAWGATGVVTIVLLLLASGCGFAALAWLRATKARLAGKDPA